MSIIRGPIELRCEHRHNPVGITEKSPRLSWRLEDERQGACQRSWEIEAASSYRKLVDGQADLWRSGRKPEDRSIDIVWDGEPLGSRCQVFWRVRIWDMDNKVTGWSEIASFEIGLARPADWQAKWIGCGETHRFDSPSPYLRRDFKISGQVRQARLYITARGIFECLINGRRVGDDYFTPGWTDYRKRFQVMVYDVTDLVDTGENAIGVTLAAGWYAGRIGWLGQINCGFHRGYYGDRLALLAQLEVVYADGTRETIISDDQWRHSLGPVLSADLYDGESYDARLEMPGWSTPSFEDDHWKPVAILTPPTAELSGTLTEPVRKQEELAPVSRTQLEDGIQVFNLGQNIAGWPRIEVEAPSGTRITIRLAEMLQEDGSIYTENLRSAKCVDHYTCKGGGVETWEPRFTFHGFQYVEISGLTERARVIGVTGIVLHSEIPHTGSFECSDKLVNRLQENIVWGQRDNYFEVPTDCPQRDERLGWTGDAQIFIRTGAFNRDIAAFFTKWCLDVADSQLPDGKIPHVVPDVLDSSNNQELRAGAAAWSDAVVICPWTMYLTYGDIRILERNFNSMVAWVEWRRRTSCDLIHEGARYGDWHAPDKNTPKVLIATAYFAQTSRLLGKIAKIIGRHEESAIYTDLAHDIGVAFRRHFVTPSGRVMGNSQTAYLLALEFDLLTPRQIPLALERLVEDIKRRGWTLSTGFVGTPLLAPVLTRFGRVDVAYRLLMQRESPSWLFSVLQGATTMWESWNSYSIKDGLVKSSFNHYVYGAIGEWIYSTVAGIDLDPDNPGYKHIIFAPRPGGGLTWAKAELLSRYGRIASSWRIAGDRFLLDIVVPPNTTGTVELPGQEPIEVLPGQHSFSASVL